MNSRSINNDAYAFYCRDSDRRQQQSLFFHQLSRKSLPYQIIKYVLLILNIMIVATTAIITIIVCLLPTIIYEKKLALDNVATLLRTGNLDSKNHRYRMRENEIIQLSAREIDTIRLIRYLILALSALIILNQTLAVYGLFKERSYHILFSTVIIGLVGQLSLFVLPASIFILITIYLIFSICYVILLNHLNLLAKEPMIVARSPSRGSSLEPQIKNCCCRCKNCFCNQPGNNQMDNAIIRRTSIQSQLYQNPNVPYYYGSLGRRTRDSRSLLSSLQPSKLSTNDNTCAYKPPYRATPRLKMANKFSNMNLIDIGNQNIYSNREKELFTGNYLSSFERSKDTTII